MKMASATLEIRAYEVPRAGSLGGAYPVKDGLKLMGEGSLQGLETAVAEAGFGEVSALPTKRGLWAVYERQNHGIPNFPEGQTVVHSMFALYLSRHKAGAGQAVMRMSAVQFPQEEFVGGLQAFTRCYVERPFLLGFPSVFITNGHLQLATMFLSGLIGAAAGYSAERLVGSPNLGLGGNVMVGQLAGLGLMMLLDEFSEKYARRQIRHLDEYFAGDAIRHVLFAEREHAIKALIGRELYAALLQTGVNISPENFLTMAYKQMPSGLVDERAREMAKSELVKSGRVQLAPEQSVGTALQEMLRIAQILLKRPSPQPA